MSNLKSWVNNGTETNNNYLTSNIISQGYINSEMYSFKHKQYNNITLKLQTQMAAILYRLEI